MPVLFGLGPTGASGVTCVEPTIRADRSPNMLNLGCVHGIWYDAIRMVSVLRSFLSFRSDEISFPDSMNGLGYIVRLLLNLGPSEGALKLLPVSNQGSDGIVPSSFGAPIDAADSCSDGV